VGQEKRLIQIFEKEYEGLLTIAVGILKEPHLALDVVQDVAVMLAEERYEEKQIRNPKAFLYSCTRNRARDYLRREKRYLHSTEELAYSLMQRQKTLYDETFKNVELRDWLDSYFRSISPQMREAFAMHILDGYTIREIAEIMDMDDSTLRQRFHRMKKGIPKEALFHMLLLSMNF